MPSYNVTDGKMSFTGTSLVWFFPTRFLLVKFQEREKAWLRYRAVKGKLESIWIKKIVLNSGKKSQGSIVPLYYDNNNALYNEDDLATELEAISLAENYYNTKLATINKALQWL